MLSSRSSFPSLGTENRLTAAVMDSYGALGAPHDLLSEPVAGRNALNIILSQAAYVEPYSQHGQASKTWLSWSLIHDFPCAYQLLA